MKNIKKRWWFLILVSILLLCGDIVFYIMGAYYPNELNKGNLSLPKAQDGLSNQQQVIQKQISDISLNSPYAMLIDLSDQTILYKKQASDKIYPASLTKVMSAIVALDLISDLQEFVTVTSKDLEGLAEANASVAGLSAGDKISYEDLLYALILPSGADAANVLANHLTGSMQAFVQEMNEKAQAYGMLSTHFVNASGLHEDEHYSTIADLTIMMNHAWKNTVFQKILTTTNYEIKNLHLSLSSTLLLYGDSLSFPGGDIIGGKSGYTLEAECCLISIAKMQDGHLYMFLSAKAPGDPLENHYHINDAKQIYSLIAKSAPTA